MWNLKHSWAWSTNEDLDSLGILMGYGWGFCHQELYVNIHNSRGFKCKQGILHPKWRTWEPVDFGQYMGGPKTVYGDWINKWELCHQKLGFRHFSRFVTGGRRPLLLPLYMTDVQLSILSSRWSVPMVGTENWATFNFWGHTHAQTNGIDRWPSCWGPHIA